MVMLHIQPLERCLTQKQNVKPKAHKPLVKRLKSVVQNLAVIIMISLYKQADCKVEEGLVQVPIKNDCVCPGDIVMYECTVFGDFGGITVWTGDFFRCSNGNQEIALVHSQFTDGPGGEASSTRTCHSGDVRIVGRIIRVKNGSFTSQLNVTLTPDSDILAGTSIECAYDNGTSVYPIGSATLNYTAATILQPRNINLTYTYSLSDINFNWNTHSPSCSAIHYNILASNCGSCPTTTNYTNVTCTNIPTDGSVCIFVIQTVVCSNFEGEPSYQVSLTNKNRKSSISGSSKHSPTLISTICLSVALAICLIGLIIVTILLIKSKAKLRTVVVNTMDKAETSKTQTPRIHIKKNIAYIMHSLKTHA